MERLRNYLLVYPPPVHLVYLGDLPIFLTSSQVKVEWTDVPEGTGEMIKRLKNGDADVIVALTEGLVADIAMEITNHNKLLDDTTGPSDETKSFSPTVQLIGTYVKSPLCWAISAGKHGKYKTVEDIKGSTIAISRYFSGSHLMACVLVQERGWRMNDVSFEVCGNFASLRNAVNEDPQSTGGANDGNQEKKQGKSVFLWETYMTKPYHERYVTQLLMMLLYLDFFDIPKHLFYVYHVSLYLPTCLMIRFYSVVSCYVLVRSLPLGLVL